MILVGDVGGTNTRLALAVDEAGHYRLDHLHRYDTPSDLPALIREYLSQFAPGAPPVAAALCGAGPVRDDGSIALTNHPCVLVPNALAAAAGLATIGIVNDFEAVAHAIPVLADGDLRACGGRPPGDPTAPRLVIGAGTGLGLASILPYRDEWLVLPGEGGHVDLAPVDDEEHAAWQALRAAHGALSAESLLSGAGFEHLYEVISGEHKKAPAITMAARNGHYDAMGTMRLFARWLGRVTGNAALTLGARGGVYLAGGIVPGWGDLFDVREFRNGFVDKKGFESWLGAIPSWVVTHPQPALLGLARLARPA